MSEWQGVRAALRYLDSLQRPFTSTAILIQGDSQLVIHGITGRWACKAEHLRAYRDECHALLKSIGLPWFAEWIPREENAQCDKLAAMA